MWHQPDHDNRYYFNEDSSVKSSSSEKHQRKHCWYMTLYEFLAILCAAAIPIAVGIYTAVIAAQNQRQADQARLFDLQKAAELRQQELYDEFLDKIYNLDKDGYLVEGKAPWALANAYFRAANREWDALRKADVLRFLVEKRLIGRRIGTGKALRRANDNIIALNQLNFDYVHLASSTDSLNQLNMQNIDFNQVSLTNSTFAFVDLDGGSFIGARLNYARFRDSSLTYCIFERTQLKFTDFGNANLTGAQFIDVDLSTAKITPDQISQAACINTTLPNNTICNALGTSTVQSTFSHSTQFRSIETTISSTDVNSHHLTSDDHSSLNTELSSIAISSITTTSEQSTSLSSEQSTSETSLTFDSSSVGSPTMFLVLNDTTSMTTEENTTSSSLSSSSSS